MAQEPKNAMRMRQSTGGISERLERSSKSITGIRSRNVKPPNAFVTAGVKTFALMSAQPSATRMKSGAQSAM